MMKRKRLSAVFSGSLLFLLLLLLGSFQSVAPVASLESGPTLRALKVNGTDAYLEVDSGPVMGDLAAITIEAWVYRHDQTGCETIVGHNYHESFWFGTCTGGKLRFYPRGTGSAVDSIGAIPAGRWTHVAVTYDGATVRFYINGMLDKEADSPGGLGSSTSFLGIGVDVATIGEGYDNFFRGMLDEVRIWGVARSVTEIPSDMLDEIDGGSGLLGLWRLNGSYVDLLGNHHTSEKGGVVYDTGGVLPSDLYIPVAQNIPDIDGQCGATEYNVAERVALRSNERTVYLQHSATDLYVCIKGLWLDAGGDDQAIVAIDHNLTRDALAQSDDYRYIVERDGDTRAERGNGIGGYVPITLTAGSWAAAADLDLEFYWNAEFRISRASPGPWAEMVGLDILASGDAPRPPADHFPVGAFEHIPRTWSRVIIRDDGPSVPPLHLFSGRVEDSADVGLSGVRVHLYSSNGAVGGSLIATTTTNSEGHYTFEYRGYAPNWFHVVEEDPRGAYSVDADAGEDGEAVSLNLLAYRGVQAGRTYSAGRFVDSLGAGLAPASFNRHYLIVYGEPVEPSDLAVLVDMKRLQGFQVEWMSVEEIEDTIDGLDRQSKIRNWLKSRWQALRPRPIYALLIGHGGIIPTPDYGNRFVRPNLYPGDPGYVPLLRTDWYYADLDSNWDVDGDRHIGECLSNVDDSNPLCQNPDLPTYHEGPFGTSPGREDDWVPEISIGRIGLVTGAEVRSALATSVAAESSGSLDKRKGAVAGAFWWNENQPWDAATSSYAAGNWDGNQPYGYDSAEALEAGLRPILNEHLDSFTTLYNSTKPDNPAALSPTRFVPDIPLTSAGFREFWQNGAFGLANLAGHGDPHGVYLGESWTNDWDRPGIVNNPADPSTCPDPPCLELESEGFMIHHAFAPTSSEVAPVVYALSCGTGEVGYSCDFSFNPPVCTPGRYAIASTLPMRGAVAAWVGASMTHTMGWVVEGLQHRFNSDLLGGPLLLGDALWKNNQWVASFARRPDWRTVNMMVNGDPAYSYWGNPLDTRAYWPQAGRDWYGSSASPAGGPSVPMRLWTTEQDLSVAPSSIDRNGNIYTVYHDSIVVRAPDGTIIDSQSLPAGDAPYPPAITTDGVYVFTVAGLTVLDPQLNVRETFSSAEEPLLSAVAVGPPVVGPDGVVWLPTAERIVRYTPGRLEAIPSSDRIEGRVVLANDGAAIWRTFDGRLRRYHRDRFGVVTETALFGPGGFLTDPTVAPGNRVLVGRGHDLISVNATTGGVQWTFDTGRSIRAAPAVGPTGVAYVVNQGNEVVAVNAAGALLWRRPLGQLTISTPAVDGARVYVTAGLSLYALDTANGEVVWSANLGAYVGQGGGPVIGSNRTIYVTIDTGQVVAIGQSFWLIAPSDLTLEPITGGVTAYWRDNSQGELGFRIDRCDGENCVFVGMAPANAEAMPLQQMPIGETFTFRIQAVGSESESRAAATYGESSDFVFSLPVTPLPLAALPPTDLTATPGSSDAIDLTWQYTGNRNLLLGFDIFRAAQADGPYEKVAVVASDASDYRDTKLQPATTYFYKIATVNASGSSPQAGPKSATTKPQSLPMPTAFQGEEGENGVELTWQDNATTESGYLIEREVPGGIMEAIALLPANATSYTDDYLLADGINRYRVRAVATAADSPPAETQVEVGESQQNLFLPFVRR